MNRGNKFPFLIHILIKMAKTRPVETCHSDTMAALKSLANSAKTLAMELFMDVNDIELFEDSTRKARRREETELTKTKGGLCSEQVS